MSSSPLLLEPGLHDNIPSQAYHADPCPAPSLSSTCARTLFSKSPKHAWLEHPRLGGATKTRTAAMDLGAIVHAQLSGLTMDFEVGNFDSFRSIAAKAWREKVEAAGRLAVLEADIEEAKPIVAAIREKAAAGLTIDPFVAGKPEVTAVWKEEDAYCRARYDRLVLDTAYADIWDWKTASDVSDEGITSAIIDEGYHIQAAHYRRGLRRIMPEFAGRISFIFVFVEKKAPYTVRRVCLSEGFISIGEEIIHRALGIWQNCIKTETWPDGSGETLTVEPPSWYLHKFAGGAL